MSLHDEPNQPFDLDAYRRGIRGSAKAARKWIAEEKILVDRAIYRAARTFPEFNADHVWAILPEDFPVTKGLAGRLNAAVHQGIIESTGKVEFAQRGGDHDHRQRLAVWRSLVCRYPEEE